MRMQTILRTMTAKPWVIEPTKLELLIGVVRAHMSPERPLAQLALDAAEPPNSTYRSGVMVIPLLGTIAPRMGAMEALSGGTTLDSFRAQFRDAINSKSVDSVILDVDSPGGYIDSVPETAALIRESRGKKPIVAVANSLMASAAYWIGTAADEVIVSPSGSVGSVGVVSLHVDTSKADEAAGFKYSLISAGQFKTEANSYEPLTPEARERLQADVDYYYGMFLGDLRKQRDGRTAAAKSNFGDGRMFNAQEAVENGMADRVGTLDATVTRFLRAKLNKAKRALN